MHLALLAVGRRTMTMRGICGVCAVVKGYGRSMNENQNGSYTRRGMERGGMRDKKTEGREGASSGRERPFERQRERRSDRARLRERQAHGAAHVHAISRACLRCLAEERLTG